MTYPSASGPVEAGDRLTGQRLHGDVAVGDVVGPVEFALPIYRLVVAAGGNRDFNSIHHNRSTRWRPTRRTLMPAPFC